MANTGRTSQSMTVHIKWRTVSGVGLGACLVSLCCAPVFGQSLGEVARQERQRKEQQAARALHVYTNDDLRKSKILVPEDQARALAARNNPNNQMPAPVDLASAPNAIALLQFLLPASAGDTDIKDPSSWEPEPVASGISSALSADSIGLEAGAASAPVKTNERPEPVRRRQVAKIADPFAPKKIVRREAPAQVAIEPVHATRKSATSIISASSISLAWSNSSKSVHEQDSTSSKADKILVQPGDSLWKLAQRYLGDGNRWFDLAALNPQLESPNLIRAGEWIRVRASQDEGTKQVVVRLGDTLWSVAETELGSARGVECIVEANPQLESSDLIRPGQKLLLPRNCGVAR